MSMVDKWNPRTFISTGSESVIQESAAIVRTIHRVCIVFLVYKYVFLSNVIRCALPIEYFTIISYWYFLVCQKTKSCMSLVNFPPKHWFYFFFFFFFTFFWFCNIYNTERKKDTAFTHTFIQVGEENKLII